MYLKPDVNESPLASNEPIAPQSNTPRKVFSLFIKNNIMHFGNSGAALGVTCGKCSKNLIKFLSCLKALNGNIEKNNSTVPKANSKVLIGELFNKLYKPKICQLEGDVYAGGFLIIAGCNYVVSKDGIILGLPEVKRGLFPMQVMESLSKVISVRNLVDWCIRGYNLDVITAHKWGLISVIINQVEIESVVSKWLNEVVSNSPIAIKYGLEAMDTISSSESNHKYLAEMLELVLKSEDANEGISAFKEKRKPNWK